MELFRLRSLRIRDNNIFTNSIEFNFSQESDSFSVQSPYFTLIIGPNGTGKSNLLKILIDIFRLAYEKKNGLEITQYPSGKYALEYFFTDANYTILNTLGWQNGEEAPLNFDDKKDEKGIRFFKDGSEIDAKEFPIPNSIIALSIMLTDKYPVLRDPSKFPIYNYLGIRKDSNTAGTRTYINRTIDYIFDAASNESFLDDVKEMLDFLGLDKQFYVSYSPRYKHIFFTGNITQTIFEEFFNDYRKYLKRESEPWSVGVYLTIKENEPEIIPKIVDLLNYLHSQLQPLYEGSRSQFFEFDIFKTDRDLNELFTLLPYLYKLDLISYPSIVLSKFGRYFSVEDSSSGEYHFISTVISLLAKVANNSIILIDEPEISLHPNWQMKYIDFLNQVFKRHNAAHFIICTHSHFLVSDLKSENSTLISLIKDGSIKTQTVSKNTFGWSAEQVLLEVFKVATTRNYYIAEKVGEILELVSKVDREDDKIKTMVQELINENVISLSEEDPLKPVINRLIEKYA